MKSPATAMLDGFRVERVLYSIDMTDRHRRQSLFRCLWLATAVALILILLVGDQ